MGQIGLKGCTEELKTNFKFSDGILFLANTKFCLTEILKLLLLKIYFQLFSATVPHQSVLQKTFFNYSLKTGFFKLNLHKKLPTPDVDKHLLATYNCNFNFKAGQL